MLFLWSWFYNKVKTWRFLTSFFTLVFILYYKVSRMIFLCSFLGNGFRFFEMHNIVICKAKKTGFLDHAKDFTNVNDYSLVWNSRWNNSSFVKRDFECCHLRQYFSCWRCRNYVIWDDSWNCKKIWRFFFNFRKSRFRCYKLKH